MYWFMYYFRQFVVSFKKFQHLFSFTRSRSRLRIKNSRSRSCPKTGRLRNPGLLRQWRQENDYLPSYREYSTRGLIKPFLNPSQPATHTHTPLHLEEWWGLGEGRGAGGVTPPWTRPLQETADGHSGQYCRLHPARDFSQIFSYFLNGQILCQRKILILIRFFTWTKGMHDH